MVIGCVCVCVLCEDGFESSNMVRGDAFSVGRKSGREISEGGDHRGSGGPGEIWEIGGVVGRRKGECGV